MVAKVFTIANQKGGVGKTTTATALAGAFRRKGFRVLFIDADPQCNSSDTYRAEIDGVATLYDVLYANEPIKEAIQHLEHGDIVACDSQLQQADKMFTGLGVAHLLKKAAEPILNDYDYIIIDTHPDFGILTQNAMTFADYIIIPITADRYALQGLSDFYKNIQQIREYTNPKLLLAGILLIKYDARTKLDKTIYEIMPEIANQLNTVFFDSKIRESVAARKAQSERYNLFDFAPYSTPAFDYASLVEELLERGL